jgi:transposase
MQMVAAAVLDGEGHPICCELWPGNTTDVKSLLPVVARLRKRFGIGEVCVVADRGMISHETIQELESPQTQWKYILGARMRRQKEVNEQVLGRAGAYREVTPERSRSKDPAPLKVKEVWVEDRRYVVCLNEEQKRKEVHDREAIVEHLREQLKHGEKSLIGNKGYRKYIKVEGENRFTIDETKIEAEARYDGKWVLRTNLDLPAEEVALKYKQLWMVEDIFRTLKSILETRPIYHKCTETIRGHVFCSFLALCLRKDLADRLASRGAPEEWSDIVRDLNELQEVHSTFNGKSFILRSQLQGCAYRALQAAGVAVPPTIREV